MLIISPLVSLTESTKSAVIGFGINAVAFKDFKPDQFVASHMSSPISVAICSPEHLKSRDWQKVLTDSWSPDFVAWDEAQCAEYWTFRAYTAEVVDWFNSTFTSCQHLFTSATLGLHLIK